MTSSSQQRIDIPTKALQNGFSIPVYGYGTWKIGGWPGADRDKKKDQKAIESIQYAIETGIQHIDTAEMYGNGHAEELIGEAIKPYKRSDLFLTSKVRPNHLSYNNILKAAKNSLARLGTDYLDLYLLHMPNPSVPIAESMKALDTLVAQGVVRNIGVSNFSRDKLTEAQTYTKNKIVVNQVKYSLGFRHPEKSGLVKYCQEHDIMIVAYTPLEQGLFMKQTFQILENITHKYTKTLNQIALNWLISQPNVVVISKTLSERHLQENLESLAFTMGKDDIELLRKNFPIQRNPQYLDYDITWRILSLANMVTQRL